MLGDSLFDEFFIQVSKGLVTPREYIFLSQPFQDAFSSVFFYDEVFDLLLESFTTLYSIMKFVIANNAIGILLYIISVDISRSIKSIEKLLSN